MYQSKMVPATAEICGSWPSATSRGSCEEVDGEEDDGAGEDDDPGALQVDAQHVVLLGTVGLPAQRLQRARHAQLQHFATVCMIGRNAL